MKLHPRLSKAGVELVKRFEGLRRKAARLPGGGWTIGYGHTASAREGAEVSPDDAEALLLYDLNRVANAVDELVLTPLNTNQFAALTAFAFNVGVDAFGRSNVLKRINEGGYLQAAAALEMWRKADFQGEAIVVDALVRRRAAEKILFLTPPEGFRPAPSAVVKATYDPAPELARAEAGLADAADLRVALDGEAAAAELHTPAPAPLFEPPPPPVSATAVAAQNVADRLNRLFEDEPPPPPARPTPVDDLDAPPFPDEPAAAAEPEANPLADAEPAPPPEPAPVAPPEPAPEPEPAPGLFTPPPVYEPPPRRFPEPDAEPEAEDEPPASGFGRRYPTLGERAEAVRAPVQADPSNPLAVLALGVFGAALFCGALATMVFGRATLVNLALGLLGVVCMVPSGLRLLTQLFADRPAETDEEG